MKGFYPFALFHGLLGLFSSGSMMKTLSSLPIVSMSRLIMTLPTLCRPPWGTWAARRASSHRPPPPRPSSCRSVSSSSSSSFPPDLLAPEYPLLLQHPPSLPGHPLLLLPIWIIINHEQTQVCQPFPQNSRRGANRNLRLGIPFHTPIISTFHPPFPAV